MGKHAATVSQSSWHPTAKVLATWVTGSGATICLAVLAYGTETIDHGTFWGALAVNLITSAASWLKKNRRGEVGQ